MAKLHSSFAILVAAVVLSTAAVAQQAAPSLLQARGLPIVTGISPNGDILYPPLSYDGRYIAFHSTASNLVPKDNGNVSDIFVVDRRDKLIQRVSVNAAGQGGNNTSTYPTIAGEGRYVAFTSEASNLVPGDENGASDVFIADVVTGQLTLASKGLGGKPAAGKSYSYFPSISADGRYAVFSSNAADIVQGDTNGTWDVFVFDRQTGQTRLVSKSTSGQQGNGPSMHGVISGNGRYVAFHSRATNLVSDDTNNTSDIFLHNLQTGETTLISRAPDGTVGNARSERPSISYDGLVVSFSSDASNLVPNDTNNAEDVFVYHHRDKQLRRASVLTGGGQMTMEPIQMDRKSVVSPDGMIVAFRSDGPPMTPGGARSVDIYVHNMASGATDRVSSWPDGSAIAGDSEHHALSYDGSIVSFSVHVTRSAPAQFNAARLDKAAVATSGADKDKTFSHGLIRNRATGQVNFILE